MCRLNFVVSGRLANYQTGLLAKSLANVIPIWPSSNVTHKLYSKLALLWIHHVIYNKCPQAELAEHDGLGRVRVVQCTMRRDEWRQRQGLLSDGSSDRLHFRALTHESGGWCHQHQDHHHHHCCDLWLRVFWHNGCAVINKIGCHCQLCWSHAASTGSPSKCHHQTVCHHHRQVKCHCQVCDAMYRDNDDITLDYIAWVRLSIDN